MKTRTKAMICGGIFLTLLVAGGITESINHEKRQADRDGQTIQGVNESWNDDFAPREYIKIRPKQTKEELPE
ncbi:hypothetical protein ACTHQ4_11900 [Alkalicoccobacillus gibsonii]|uniref:hypothetical protein n=1 Tax=Alkalicoccobacillus gibsonii TaxID=79881 RepID=UPI003F7C9D1A